MSSTTRKLIFRCSGTAARSQLAGYGDAVHALELLFQGIEQRACIWAQGPIESRGIVGRRHKVLAQVLGQRLDQRNQQIVAQAGICQSKPTGSIWFSRQRNMYRHPVSIGAGLELVGEPELDAALVPEVIIQLVNMAGIALHQHLALEVERTRSP